MQSGKPLVDLPLVAGVLLSVSVHGLALYAKGLYTPPQPQLETGRTVVHLTLAPSMAKPAPPPEPAPRPPREAAPVETVAEPEPVPEPTPQPKPEPVVEPHPDPVAEPAQQESAEQIATLQEDKGVITDARPMSGIRATYPRTSQRRGEEGTVILAIEVLAGGQAGSVEVLESSGHKRLDDAAVKAAKKATYTPAKQFGRNIDSRLIQPLTFELEDK
ncbi:energy transducer TonB [Pontiella sp.]|uniref:energy transducer TonB n=2 Tax=Pontiella sp. TaxID=2837462 RepID=UPI003564561C